jgi:hypothetical protein
MGQAKKMDRVNRRKTNFIWHYIDVLSCKIEKIADIYNSTIGKEYKKENIKKKYRRLIL